MIYEPPSQNAIQKTLDAQLLSGITASMTLNNVTGIQNKPGVCVVDLIDANGNFTPSKREYISFTGVSGSTLTGLTRNADGGGSDQDHAVGAIVQFPADVIQQQALIDTFEVEHDLTDGKHTSALVTTLKATGAVVNTGTSDVTIVTPKALADSDYAKTSDITVTADSTTTFTNKTIAYADNTITGLPTGASSLSQQALINGNFDVWQRGTSVAMTAADAYTADRWYCETATAGTDKTVSREDGTGVSGSYYCARVKMVGDVDELLTFSQALESQDSIKFRGQKVTLSFYARGGAEFVADNPTLVSKIVTGKGTDQKVLAFTTSADGVAQNNTLTTGWQKFTCTTTAAIAADITQIGVSFAFTHAGSGTTTNYFEITQVQLCAGDVALPFMPKSFEEELRACQRYYVTSNNYGTPWTPTSAGVGFQMGIAVSTSSMFLGLTFPVELRKSADDTTFRYSGGVAGGGQENRVRNTNTNANVNYNADLIGGSTRQIGWISGNAALTANTPYDFFWQVDVEL